MQLPYDPALALLGIYPREVKTCVHTKICIQMYIAVLFVIVENWKQSILPSKKWKIKQTVIHAYHGHYINKKELTFESCNNLDETRGNYIEWKYPIPKAWKLHYSTSVIFWNYTIKWRKD